MSDVMYDGVTVANLPEGAFAYAGYVDGTYANWPELVARFVNTGAHLLSITVNGADYADAHSVDDEPGDEDNDQAAVFAKARLSLKSVPVIYTSASNLADLTSVLASAGVSRSQVLIWSAHYTGRPHFCGLHTCGYGTVTESDATQYYNGPSFDTSVVSPSFFDSWAPPPVVIPAPDHDWDWTSNGKYSLGVLSTSHKTDVATLLWKTLGSHSQSRFNSYVDAGDWNAPVPPGVIIRFPAGH